jgi:polyisoprenoid-binding protein YceI
VRRAALVLLAAVVLVVAGGVIFALQGDDAPPPPKLAQRGVLQAVEDPAWAVGAGSFAGYRVKENYLGVGVSTAVGRTAAVTGTIAVKGAQILSADLRADMTQLRSDKAERDSTLTYKAIETRRYPTAAFQLDGPVKIGSDEHVDGELTLHGVRAPITLVVSGALRGKRLQLVGHATIAFKDFGIEPPSIAGFVKVRSTGTLEFSLVARPSP